jgi:hypothetical protein
VESIMAQLSRFSDPETGLPCAGTTLKKIRFKTAQKIAMLICDVSAELEMRRDSGA